MCPQHSSFLGSKTALNSCSRTTSSTRSSCIPMRWCVVTSHFLFTPFHTNFSRPFPQAYAGSKRTFSALLKAMIVKDKIGIVLSLTRRNSSPVFCAMLPQVRVRVCVPTCADGAGGTGRNGRRDRVERAPWFPPRPAAVRRRSEGCADRPSRSRCVFSPAAPILQKGLKRKSAVVASEEVVDAARQWIEKLSVKNGTYPPDSYPNPGTPRYLRSKERKTQLTHHASSVGVPQRAARSERVPRRIRSRELRGSDAAKGR